MRIGLETWGSDGDILPILGLGSRLVARGHEVVVRLTSVDGKDYRPLCGRLGLRCPDEPAPASDLQALLARGRRLLHPVRRMRLMVETIFTPHLERMTRQAEALAADCDVLVAHVAVYPAAVAAARVGRPCASVAFWPGMIPSDFSAPFPLPDLGPLNRLAWRAAHWCVDRLFLDGMDRAWRAAGLPARTHVLGDAAFSLRLSLVAASPALWPAPADWAGRHDLVGEFPPPGDGALGTLPEGLDGFLAEEEPPVYLGFGSLQQSDPEGAMDLLLGAVRRAGCRAVVHTSSPRFPAGVRDGRVFFLGRASHALLLPRCAAAVHHGGAGTTHAAARAGLPALAVPFFEEQESWGRRLHAAGLGARPIPFFRASARRLAAGIRRLLDDPALRRTAQAVAARMAEEDGPGQAAERIERLAG